MTSRRDGRRRDKEPAAAVQRGAPRDFTLLETIVVLTLTVVIVFLPRPNVTLELDKATSLAVDAMRIARSHPIAESRPVPLTVTRDGQGIQVDNRQISLGSWVWLATPARRAILFAPDASAAGGTLRVLVADRTRLIRIDWLTDRITIEEAS